MTESHELFHDDELLSAYLDGELDEALRIEVEERLQHDPEARVLLSQLQSVSESVSTLPTHTLGNDLREAVLSRAIVQRREELPEESSYRRWVYAAAAIAAVLLLMIYQPQQDGGNQQLAGMVRQSKPATDPELRALATDQRAALGSFGGLGGSKEIPLGDLLDFSLRRGVAQSSRAEVLGEQLGDAPSEDFHVHLRSSSDKPGLGEFEKLLSDVGVVFVDGLSDSSEAQSSKVEMILLEAPLFTVQRIVTECGESHGVWKSAEILRANNSAPSILFLTLPESKLGQVSWAGSMDSAPLGWAKHLNRDRLLSELGDGFESVQISRGQDTVRVLFILHPTAQ